MGRRGNRRARRDLVDDSGTDLEQEAAPPQAVGKCACPFELQVDDGSILVEIKQDDVGMRIDAILPLRLPDAPTRSRVQRAIKDGGVLLNGAPINKISTKLRIGDRLIWVRDAVQHALKDVEAEDIPLCILHEDDDIIVINKPAGMAVHPAGGLRSGTLVNALLHHTPCLSQLSAAIRDVGDGDCTDEEELDHQVACHNLEEVCQKAEVIARDKISRCAGAEPLVRPGIVHRLDRGTSGIMVVAKNNVAHAKLAAQFAAHTSQRSYLALVSGVPKPVEGTVESSIGRDPGDRLRMAVVKDGKGKVAITHYSIIEEMDSGSAALVQFRLETGRTHQIRVHSRHIGHPLMGDAIYNGAQLLCGPRTEERVKLYARLFGEGKILERPALHAETLSFAHPVSDKWMSFRVDLPSDMLETMACLRKLDARS